MTLQTSRTPGAPATRRPRTGRIPRLAKANREALCENLRVGVPVTTAGTLAGIPKGTLMEWLAKGRDDGAREPYRSLAVDVDLALAEFQASKVKQVGEAAVKDHRAATWLLERRFPNEFGDPRVQANIAVQVNVMSSPEWRELLQRVASVLRDKHPDALRTLAAEFGYASEEPLQIEAA